MDESVQEHLTPTLDAESEMLLKAAAIIEAEGWFPADGPDAPCAWSAICRADGRTFGSVLSRSAGSRFSKAIGLGGEITPIFSWNDARTKEEVVAKLRSVALCG